MDIWKDVGEDRCELRWGGGWSGEKHGLVFLLTSATWNVSHLCVGLHICEESIIHFGIITTIASSSSSTSNHRYSVHIAVVTR